MRLQWLVQLLVVLKLLLAGARAAGKSGMLAAGKSLFSPKYIFQRIFLVGTLGHGIIPDFMF